MICCNDGVFSGLGDGGRKPCLVDDRGGTHSCLGVSGTVYCLCIGYGMIGVGAIIEGFCGMSI